jgi:hypothetical protein
MNTVIPLKSNAPKVLNAAFTARLAEANRIARALRDQGCHLRRMVFGETEIEIVADRNPYPCPKVGPGIHLRQEGGRS